MMYNSIIIKYVNYSILKIVEYNFNLLFHILSIDLKVYTIINVINNYYSVTV